MKKMIKYIIILIFVCTPAFGDSIDINIGSLHSDNSYKYNNLNLGLGYTADINRDWQILGGWYNNSYNKNSIYLMSRLKHDIGSWSFGVNVGFVTGYNDIALSENEKKYPKHNDNNYKHKSHYRSRDRKSQYVKNLNKYQLMVLPSITFLLNKSNAIDVSVMPVLTKNVISFVAFRYKYIY